jgi:hypothetical protein
VTGPQSSLPKLLADDDQGALRLAPCPVEPSFSRDHGLRIAGLTSRPVIRTQRARARRVGVCDQIGQARPLEFRTQRARARPVGVCDQIGQARPLEFRTQRARARPVSVCDQIGQAWCPL